MLGESVVLIDGQGDHIRSFVAALAHFPTDPQWAVVGGFAVYVRIANVHRITNDLDTVSRNQHLLVEILVAEPNADRLATAKLQLNQDGAVVVVDVMDDASDTPLPTESGARAFAHARRMALATCESIDLIVLKDEAIIGRANVPVATTPSLIALKAIAIPHRAQSNRPEKVGSDIHDLTRLVQNCNFDDTINSITSASAELRDWVGRTLVKWFSPNQDLRYTTARLHRLTQSPDTQALTEDDLAIIARLGHELLA